ncbi:hypothetical protein Gpo141_00010305 [Globisporangium polare]
MALPELSDTALKLSQVIEREAKRMSALRSSHLSRVRSSISSSFSRNSRKNNNRKLTSSVAPVPEHAQVAASVEKEDEPRLEGEFPRGSKVAQLHRQGSKMRNSVDADDQLVVAGTMRGRLWLLLDDPQSSQMAHYLSVFIFGFVTISTIVFIAQTEDGLAVYARELNLIETICATTFSIELLLRVLACPSRTTFFRNYANWIDILAILPFYLERILQVDNAGTFGAIRIVRLTRVARVLKMSRYSSAIQVFVQAIAISMKALSMLIFLMAIAMVVFSSMIYFAEFTRDGCRAGGWVGDCTSDNTAARPAVFASSIAGAAAARAASSTDCICVDPNPYKSIASSFWWCIVTMTTVGYGDMTPVTVMGKVVGCASMLMGMLVLALPITVIGTNFQKVMKSVMQQTMKSNVDYLKGKRMLCRNEIEAILERFHAVTEDIHLDVDDIINVYDEDNNGMLEDEELAKFRTDLEILQNRFMMNHPSSGELEVTLQGSRPSQEDTATGGGGSLASTWTLGSSSQARQLPRMYDHSPALQRPMRHSSTSSVVVTRPAAVGPFVKSASNENVVRRSTALASTTWTSPASSTPSGPGSALLQRDLKPNIAVAQHTDSDDSIHNHSPAAHPEVSAVAWLPGVLTDLSNESHHPPSHRHHSGHVDPQESTPSSTSNQQQPAIDSELFWLRMMDMQHAWEERLLETEQRLEAKLQILTKILIRVEGMMELDD